MISSSGILSTGVKKCRPMKSAGRDTASASSVIGSVEVLEPSTASGAEVRLDLGEDLGLTVRVLEHRLDHEIGAGRRGRIGRRGDPREQRVEPSPASYRPRAKRLSRFALAGVWLATSRPPPFETSFSTTSMPAFAHT